MSKKKSLLERLYDGEIHVAEQINPLEDEAYKKQWEQTFSATEAFGSSLSANQKEAFEQMLNQRVFLTSIENFLHFEYGLCFGLQLMAEILQKEI